MKKKLITIPASWLEKVVEAGDNRTRIGNFEVAFSNSSEASRSIYYNVYRVGKDDKLGYLRVSDHWSNMLIDGHKIHGVRVKNQYGRIIRVFHGVCFLGYATKGYSPIACLNSNRRYTYKGMIGVLCLRHE